MKDQMPPQDNGSSLSRSGNSGQNWIASNARRRSLRRFTRPYAATMLLLATIGIAPSGAESPWQNPNMSPNPTNNIHNDSYLSDSYPYPGPAYGTRCDVDQVGFVVFRDPDTGRLVSTVLGECAAHAFDANGDVQTICVGLPDANTGEVIRRVVTIDKETLRIKAHFPMPQTFTSITDFGGAGYFYQDDQYRMVVASGDGHIRVLERQPSPLSRVDRYDTVRQINVTGVGGALLSPRGVDALDLYALVPDKAGNIWFTTTQSVVGIVTPDDQVAFIDLNDADGDGWRDPQPDGQFQEIANSHAVDEGDTLEGPSGPSGAYIVTTHQLYKLTLDADGRPMIAWHMPYERGRRQKSGQVSWGSGSSPTIFNMGGRRFVTITDNATPMHVNVYRAETTLAPGRSGCSSRSLRCKAGGSATNNRWW
jgi:hypothetical protein